MGYNILASRGRFLARSLPLLPVASPPLVLGVIPFPRDNAISFLFFFIDVEKRNGSPREKERKRSLSLSLSHISIDFRDDYQKNIISA